MMLLGNAASIGQLSLRAAQLGLQPLQLLPQLALLGPSLLQLAADPLAPRYLAPQLRNLLLSCLQARKTALRILQVRLGLRLSLPMLQRPHLPWETPTP